jgi:hydroxyacylglutathione hydrolase
MIEFGDGAGAAGSLDVRWHAGWVSAKHDPSPEIQAHAYDEHTVIMRQNKSVNYEAPFMFLLFGNERALLLDTGATAEPAYFPLRSTVDGLIDGWLRAHPRQNYGLLVAHTHAHGDHVAGDPQFTDRPHTTVVGPKLAAVTEFYGFDDWPNGVATVDLGGRVLDVIPGPGHQEAATVYYDRYTQLLFTGDSLYPGRLYIFDWPAYAATVDRLLDFCAGHPVSHVLGCHIEMNTAGHDYPIFTTYHPDEPPLQLTVDHLRAVRAAIGEVAGQPGPHPYGDFILYGVG